MIKQLIPKTETALNFIKKNGDLFHLVGQTGPATIIIHAIKNGVNMSCEIRDDSIYIDGEEIKWS